MLKRPVVNLNLTSYLTRDDMDLLVTIGHIRDQRRFNRSSHFHRFSEVSLHVAIVTDCQTRS
jgi:hypothetical protein